jgi:hypothetical protein
MGPNIGYLLWKGHPGLCHPRTLDCNQQTYHQNPRDLIPEEITFFAFRELRIEKKRVVRKCLLHQ